MLSISRKLSSLTCMHKSLIKALSHTLIIHCGHFYMRKNDDKNFLNHIEKKKKHFIYHHG